MNSGITCRIWKPYGSAAAHRPTGQKPSYAHWVACPGILNEMINKIRAIISLMLFIKNVKIFVAVEIPYCRRQEDDHNET